MNLWLAAFLILSLGCIQAQPTNESSLLSLPDASLSPPSPKPVRTKEAPQQVEVIRRYPQNTNQVCQTNLVIGWANSTGCISDVWISGDLMHWKLHSSVTNVGAVTYLRYVINEPPPCFARVGNR